MLALPLVMFDCPSLKRNRKLNNCHVFFFSLHIPIIRRPQWAHILSALFFTEWLPIIKKRQCAIKVIAHLTLLTIACHCCLYTFILKHSSPCNGLFWYQGAAWLSCSWRSNTLKCNNSPPDRISIQVVRILSKWAKTILPKSYSSVGGPHTAYTQDHYRCIPASLKPRWWAVFMRQWTNCHSVSELKSVISYLCSFHLVILQNQSENMPHTSPAINDNIQIVQSVETIER